MIGNANEQAFSEITQMDTSTDRLVAYSKVLEVVKDSFITDIDQKDRIIQKCVDFIEEELDQITR